ncbi:MAG: asparagine synthase (glutamine-hydrolyzing) [Clostridiales bacterium]|nr:asparagine synthase (glutamine-hydrolyzing) [Clostridiales bacterium]
MCGISGFCNFETNFLKNRDYYMDILINMREAIAHRGSDTVGEYLTENVGLSQTRLTIRDLKNGNQPIIRNKDGRTCAIVYNGEIYNCESLKSDLESKGYIFETTTDTEIILYAYMEYGAVSVNMLNGIFAYGIWDSREKALMLFRDRFGVKPLFYTVHGSRLIFGSEPKALFKYPGFTPALDDDGLREVLGIGPARSEGCGVFKDLREVKYGSYLYFSRDCKKEIKYWDITAKEHRDSPEETTAYTRWLIEDSVKSQMVSDVPVCSFLSGGIDSSIVTALACKYLEEEGKKLNTFSFDFTDNDKYFKSNSFQPTRDRPFVDMVLERYKTNHTYLECDELLLADLLEEAVYCKDLPGMADVDSSLLYFCRLVKKHNKAALTGECADEIFGGYPWFFRPELYKADTFPWSVNLHIRESLIRPELLKKLDLKGYVHQKYTESMAKIPHLITDSRETLLMRKINYLSIKWFMTTLLDRMDRTSVCSGLEARVPFADYRIVEYVYNVPWEIKAKDGEAKYLLRKACEDLLPPEIIRRRKSPYPKTYNPKYEALLKERLRAVLNSDSPISEIYDKQAVLDFMDKPSDYGTPWFGQLMCGPQMLAYILQINSWLLKYSLI